MAKIHSLPINPIRKYSMAANSETDCDGKWIDQSGLLNRNSFELKIWWLSEYVAYINYTFYILFGILFNIHA